MLKLDNTKLNNPAACADDRPHKLRLIAEKIGAVLLALLFWQFAATLIDSSILIVTPIDVLKRLGTIWREPGFAGTVAFTLSRIAVGYICAVLAAVIAAFAAARFRLLEILLAPYVMCCRAVPVASVIVMLLIWIKAANLSIVISFLVVFPVVYTNLLAGLKSLDLNLLEMAYVFRMSGIRRLRYIILPQLTPYLLSSCSVTAGMAWKAGVAAEVIGTPARSIGKMIYQSRIWLNTEDLFAWTLVLVLLSIIFERVCVGLLKAWLGRYT